MPVTPSGILSTPLDAMRALLAATPAFQTWVGADDADEALDAIYLIATPPPDDGKAYGAAELADMWPLAVIDLHPEGALSLDGHAEGTEIQYLDAGSLVVGFEDAAAVDDEGDPLDHEDAKLTFLNHLGAVLAGVAALAGTGTHLRVWRMRVLELRRSDPDEQSGSGDYFWALVQFDWGLTE